VEKYGNNEPARQKSMILVTGVSGNKCAHCVLASTYMYIDSM